MAVRPVTLNATKAGMTRLRTKGGASPETLYELTNGFVNASRCPQQRPGTTYVLVAGGESRSLVKGLCSFDGKLVSFCHTQIGFFDSRLTVEVLRHPTDGGQPIKTIHFAKPYMGFLYVVAEFDDGFIGHYWLQAPDAWQPNHHYMDNDMAQATVPDGFYRQAQRSINPPAWTPMLQYKDDPATPGGALADRVQPTEYIGSYFLVRQIFGPGASLVPPLARAGEQEPDWAKCGLVQGAYVLEFSTATPPPAAAPPTPTPRSVPEDAQSGGRYDNRGGGFKKP